MPSMLTHLRASTAMLILTLVSAAYSLVDQASVARISSAHLYAQGLLTGVAVFSAVVARIVGQTLIVSQSGEDFSRPAQLIFLTLLPFLIAIGGLVSFGSDAIGLSHVAGIKSFAWLMGLGAWLTGYSLLQKFQFIANDRIWSAMRADLLGNIVNLLGNLAALTLGRDDSEKFVGVALATIISQSAVSIYLKLTAPNPAPVTLTAYALKMRGVITGEAAIGLAQALLPTLVVFLGGKFYGERIGAALAVGIAIGFFVDRPFAANTIIGIRRLCAAITPQERDERSRDIKRVMMLWMTAALLVAPVLPRLIQSFYVIDAAQTAVVLALVTAILCRAAASPIVALAKSARRHGALSKIEWVTGDVAVCCGLIFSAAWSHGGQSERLLMLVIILPAIAWSFAVWRTGTRLSGYLGTT